MTGLLSRASPPPVVVEGNGHILRLRDQRPADLRAALAAHGYRSHLIDHGRLVPVGTADLQPTVVTDDLAICGAEPELSGWLVGEPLSQDEIASRILVDCRMEGPAYRAHAAWVLEQAPEWLRERPAIRLPLAQLRRDREPFVSLSAAWSAPWHEKSTRRWRNWWKAS